MTTDRVVPGEWGPQQHVYLAWPDDEEEWGGALASARSEWRALVASIANGGLAVRIMVPSDDVQRGLEAELAASHCAMEQLSFYSCRYGDIWLRDTTPLLLRRGEDLHAVQPHFNGWGKKYLFPDDQHVAPWMTGLEGLPCSKLDLVVEGGALESNGAGLLLTTRSCLLDPNRNPGRSEQDITADLEASLGAKKVLWLNSGLQNDHTDGHIDTLARFVSEDTVVCMVGEQSDPNRAVLDEIHAALRQMTGLNGEQLAIHTIPSPGSILADDGTLLPASYLNFMITPTTVLVPTYGSPSDAAAVEAIGGHFPERRTTGLPARGILHGGGAFHCISKEVPLQSPATS